MSAEVQRVAIAGLGAVGLPVARALAAGIDGLKLTAVSARDLDGARRKMEALAPEIPAVPASELAGHAEIIVECVPKAAFAEVAAGAIEAGRVLVTVSGAALLVHGDLIRRAEETGARIVLATGALLGLDAVRAAAEGEIAEVRMITRKPPRSLKGAPFLEANGISIDGLTEPLLVFEGTAREGAAGFPANVNVAARARPRRHRPRPHKARDLGRPRAGAQHPRDRRRRRLSPPHHEDRERAVGGKPGHRQDHRPQRDRRPPRPRRAAPGGELRGRIGAATDKRHGIFH